MSNNTTITQYKRGVRAYLVQYQAERKHNRDGLSWEAANKEGELYAKAVLRSPNADHVIRQGWNNADAIWDVAKRLAEKFSRGELNSFGKENPLTSGQAGMLGLVAVASLGAAAFFAYQESKDKKKLKDAGLAGTGELGAFTPFVIANGWRQVPQRSIPDWSGMYIGTCVDPTGWYDGFDVWHESSGVYCLMTRLQRYNSYWHYNGGPTIDDWIRHGKPVPSSSCTVANWSTPSRVPARQYRGLRYGD